MSTLNRTEVLNVLLRENLHEARQRELTAESREMSRHTEAAALNVTVAELKALVARQEKVGDGYGGRGGYGSCGGRGR